MFIKNGLLLLRHLCRDLIVKVISKLKSVIPYLMVFVFVFATPDYAFLKYLSTKTNEIIHNLDEKTNLEDMRCSYEVVQLRTAKSKTFKKDNDAYEMVLYSDDIHYLDEGKYKEIDNTIIKGNTF